MRKGYASNLFASENSCEETISLPFLNLNDDQRVAYFRCSEQEDIGCLSRIENGKGNPQIGVIVNARQCDVPLLISKTPLVYISNFCYM